MPSRSPTSSFERPAAINSTTSRCRSVIFKLPLVQYLCHVADANNGSAGCTLAERRIRAEYVRAAAMARLIYTAISSLDGFVADNDGKFDWAEPDEEVHAFLNDLERAAGTHLYGRRLYEVLVGVGGDAMIATSRRTSSTTPRIWQAADKIVYSRTLETVSSARTRIEREFDLDAVRELEGRQRTVTCLSAGRRSQPQAIRAGLVDEYHLFLAPVLVGGGKRALPDGVRIDLELLDEAAVRERVHLPSLREALLGGHLRLRPWRRRCRLVLASGGGRAAWQGSRLRGAGLAVRRRHGRVVRVRGHRSPGDRRSATGAS